MEPCAEIHHTQFAFLLNLLANLLMFPFAKTRPGIESVRQKRTPTDQVENAKPAISHAFDRLVYELFDSANQNQHVDRVFDFFR
jgi:hypothetical protein